MLQGSNHLKSSPICGKAPSLATLRGFLRSTDSWEQPCLGTRLQSEDRNAVCGAASETGCGSETSAFVVLFPPGVVDIRPKITPAKC